MSEATPGKSTFSLVAYQALLWMVWGYFFAEVVNFVGLLGVLWLVSNVPGMFWVGLSKMALICLAIVAIRWPLGTFLGWKGSAIRLSPRGWRAPVVSRAKLATPLVALLEGMISLLAAVIVVGTTDSDGRNAWVLVPVVVVTLHLLTSFLIVLSKVGRRSRHGTR